MESVLQIHLHSDTVACQLIGMVHSTYAHPAIAMAATGSNSNSRNSTIISNVSCSYVLLQPCCRACLRASGMAYVLLCRLPGAMCMRAGMLAADGRCKTLDAAADGYVRAEAVGLLSLRTVTSLSSPAQGADSAANSATNQPHVLVLGTAVNQDGRSSSLTAPSGPAQQALMRAALHSAHMPASQVRSACC